MGRVGRWIGGIALMANNQYSGGWRYGGGTQSFLNPNNEGVDLELLKRAAAYNTPKGLLDTAIQATPVDQALSGSLMGSHYHAQEPSQWDKTSDADKAKYYAENPTMGSITQMGQKLFAGINPKGLASLQERMDPSLVPRQGLIAQGINPADAATQGRAYSGLLANDFGTPGWSAAINTNADARQARQGATPAPSTPSIGDGGFGDYSAAGLAAAFGGDESGGKTGFAKGGFVAKGLLHGPDPEGPDDGSANLDEGEYVLKKKAVKKLGRGLLDQLNKA